MVERKEEKKEGTKNWKKEDTSKNKGSTGNEWWNERGKKEGIYEGRNGSRKLRNEGRKEARTKGRKIKKEKKQERKNKPTNQRTSRWSYDVGQLSTKSNIKTAWTRRLVLAAQCWYCTNIRWMCRICWVGVLSLHVTSVCCFLAPWLLMRAEVTACEAPAAQKTLSPGQYRRHLAHCLHQSLAVDDDHTRVGQN